MIDVTYFGHSSFMIGMDGKVIFTDPWFGQSNYNTIRIQSALAPMNIRKADFVLVSHEHSDHCSSPDVESIIQKTFAKVIGPEEALSKLNVSEKLKVYVNEGDDFSLFGLDVQVTPAIHPQSRHAVGFILKGSKRVYFAGDTYDFYEMNSFSPDVAFLPIGGKVTMDPFSAMKAVKMLRPEYVIPMHYATFDFLQKDSKEFADMVARHGKSKCVSMHPGESVRLQ